MLQQNHKPIPLALATNESLAMGSALARMIAGAGIAIDDLNSAFHDCASPSRAADLIKIFQTWIETHAPTHPVRRLQILHVAEAMTAAGLNPRGIFAPELTDDDEYNEKHQCLADRDTWLAWIKTSNAAYSCDWRDSDTLAQDIADAIERDAAILVLHRVS